MNLEILINENMIKISADWFWYVLLVIFLMASTVKSGMNIYKHWLEIQLRRKVKIKIIETLSGEEK